MEIKLTCNGDKTYLYCYTIYIAHFASLNSEQCVQLLFGSFGLCQSISFDLSLGFACECLVVLVNGRNQQIGRHWLLHGLDVAKLDRTLVPG